jgi:hypothetical protein
MYPILRQVFVAILGGVVAAGVMLVANNFERKPTIALAQTSVTSPSAVDADAKRVINYQGQVFDPNGGAPYANAGLNFSFRLYNNSSGTNQVYREDKFITTNADGFFNTNIGDTIDFGDPLNIFNGQELYLRVFINNQELGPIQPITFVPYALWARHAHHLDNYDSDDFPKIIAHGVVNDDGGKASGQHFNSSRQEVAGSTVYVLDVEGINHSINDFTTIVTPACDRAIMVGVGTTGGDLIVDTFDANGNRTTCRFEFMVLQK